MDLNLCWRVGRSTKKILISQKGPSLRSYSWLDSCLLFSINGCCIELIIAAHIQSYYKNSSIELLVNKDLLGEELERALIFRASSFIVYQILGTSLDFSQITT